MHKPRFQEIDSEQGPYPEKYTLSVFVMQDDRHYRFFCFLDSVSIAEACETIALHIANERISKQEGVSKTSCYVRWATGEMFGPFPIKFGITATVQELRQGD